MQKKLLIISLNKLPVEFWYQYLSPVDFKIGKLNGASLLQSISEVSRPDAIIIDDYFMSQFDMSWLMNTTKRIVDCGLMQNIYCVSPTFLCSTDAIDPSVPNASCHYFGSELFDSIYSSLIHQENKLIA